ncbi:MAG: YggS family pyridoxal phosphate-dependent enzyme [Chitinophagaceae bacterium]
MINQQVYKNLIAELTSNNITLVAVSKTKPVEEIKQLYDLGQRDFGENYVQELVEKQKQLPQDIRWHFIGHLQSNKVRQIVPFVHLIHGVDSLKLLKEINKQAAKINRAVDCLLQIHIATEETKFGMNEAELLTLLKDINGIELKNVRICGLMGMASFTDDLEKVRGEFKQLRRLFDRVKRQYSSSQLQFSIVSMGMTADYKMAIEEGSNMVRIGSLIFGERN